MFFIANPIISIISSREQTMPEKFVISRPRDRCLPSSYIVILCNSFLERRVVQRNAYKSRSFLYLPDPRSNKVYNLSALATSRTRLRSPRASSARTRLRGEQPFIRVARKFHPLVQVVAANDAATRFVTRFGRCPLFIWQRA